MTSKFCHDHDCDRGARDWVVYLQACQCACGRVDLLWDGNTCTCGFVSCSACGSHDEPASVCEVAALVGLDHHGESTGEIRIRAGYTVPGLLGGEVTPDLPRELQRWLVEQATEAMESESWTRAERARAEVAT